MKGKFDYIVVLGFLTDPRNRLYRILISRLDKAAELYKKGSADMIVVTGGGRMKGAMGTEAHVMKRYLVKKGIRPNSILMEHESRNTIGNAFFTKRMIDGRSRSPSLIVVTNDFHMPRSRFIFRKIFGNNRKISFVESRTWDAKVLRRAVAYERESIKDTRKYLNGIDFRSSEKSIRKDIEAYRKRSMPDAMKRLMWY